MVSETQGETTDQIQTKWLVADNRHSQLKAQVQNKNR